MPHRPPPTRGSGPDPNPGCGPGGEPDGEDRSAAALDSPHDPAGSPAVMPGLVPLVTPPRPPGAPFVWQHERQLFLLDRAARGWVAAELRFDADDCRYVEVRRATYRWRREAAGALTARAVAFGGAVLARLAQDLAAWVTSASAE